MVRLPGMCLVWIWFSAGVMWCRDIGRGRGCSGWSLLLVSRMDLGWCVVVMLWWRWRG